MTKTIVHTTVGKNTARLEEWKVEKWLDRIHIVGRIYGDKNGRFEDGTIIRTSEYTSKYDNVFKEGNTVENTVSLYTLGKEKR